MGSSLAFIGIPLQAAYCASKFAARGFGESVRAELLHEGSAVTLSMVHLPAVNTPQFEWSEARLPNHPQPVPPTYSPEAAARFVVDAAFDGRRSKMLGAWNKLIFLGIKVAPAVLSHYAARTGVASQQTDVAVADDRPSNLWGPVDTTNDHGAHGSFGHQQGGFLHPTFLATLPKSAVDVTVALEGRSVVPPRPERTSRGAACSGAAARRRSADRGSLVDGGHLLRSHLHLDACDHARFRQTPAREVHVGAPGHGQQVDDNRVAHLGFALDTWTAVTCASSAVVPPSSQGSMSRSRRR
ncbi:MAG: SDR family NAD(P)-dependent oxidoreductase [Actinomycetota bacterium]|nr:SDR family NAD(P)-dependent oxidoreductase [Actinomycetota bacterium]